MRHPHNHNLTLTDATEYQGLSLMAHKGPFVESYLQALLSTLEQAMARHPRLFVIRFDLRYPQDMQVDQFTGNEVITRFFASLKAKIKHNRKQAKGNCVYAHETDVRYVWARELGQDGKPHYHVLLMLNRDAFHALGSYRSSGMNTYKRIVAAWASALGLDSSDDAEGLVHVAANGVWYLDRGDWATLNDVFQRASYLCKADTKHYGQGSHGFGCSRVSELWFSQA